MNQRRSEDGTHSHLITFRIARARAPLVFVSSFSAVATVLSVLVNLAKLSYQRDDVRSHPLSFYTNNVLV